MGDGSGRGAVRRARHPLEAMVNGSPSSPERKRTEDGERRGRWDGRWEGAGLELDTSPDQVPCLFAPPLFSLILASATDC